MKPFAKDFKGIYTADDEKTTQKCLVEPTEKWKEHYSASMNRWHDNWDVITPIFKFSVEVRTTFYTTKARESEFQLHSIKPSEKRFTE